MAIDKVTCLVDGRWMFGRVRGMGRFARQMIMPIESQCLLATSSAAETPASGQVIKRGASFFPLWEQKTFPLIAESENIRWLLCPYNTAPLCLKNVRLILVVHDLIFMESWRYLPPSISLYQNLGRIYRRFIVPHAIKKADFLVTVSEYTKNLIVEHYGVEPDRVTVIPNALDASWFSLNAPKIAQRERYILTVAGEAPSKNVRRLLHAFSLYAHKVSSPCELKIVGISQAKHAVFRKLCEKLKVEHLVHFIGYVNDEELKGLYLRARAFVFPSLYEGFGIPLLEAMATGCPIACSNTTSLPEVVGHSALLFDPRKVADMAETIQLILDDDILAGSLAENGYERVRKFDLEHVMQGFENFWRKLGFELDGR